MSATHALQKRAAPKLKDAALKGKPTFGVAPSIDPLISRAGVCACGGGCPRCREKYPLQPKLEVSESSNAFEREADRVAEQVLRMPQAGPPDNPEAQKGAGHHFSCPSSASPAQESPEVPPIVHTVVRSPGEPLDTDTREYMEPRFGLDFSQVRVHTGPRAMRSAAAIGARAYTSGHDIVFAFGEFQPQTERGRRLLAHELTHVGQQTRSAGPEALPRPNPGMIQKKDAEQETEERPSAEDESRSLQYSTGLKDRVHAIYWGLQVRIANAQAVERTDRRQKWLDTLQFKAATLLEAILTKDEPSTLEVGPLHQMLTKMEAEVHAEDDEAYALWMHTNERYANERIRLYEAGDYESELALKYLDQAFDERERRISALVDTDALVQEDILGVVHILDNQSHVRTAKIVADRQRKEAEERLDRLSEVEESPGFLETAWSIVGCDSIGECLGDVALTVATAGTGKALKFVVKGAKAVKKARKARKIVRSVQKLGSTLHKFLKEAKALDKFIGVIKGAVGDAAKTYANWLKKGWKEIRWKIVTDLIANFTTGKKQGIATVTAARIAKERIGALVTMELGIAKPDPGEIHAAIIFFMGKQHAVAASITRTFILRSLKYRTVVNVIFESIRAGTPLTEADKIIKGTLISTISETAEDTVKAIPFVAESGLYKFIVEAIRKVVQKIVG